jgi:GntR family transcriptional repressor for pyruvate dehydrogenase complex
MNQPALSSLPPPRRPRNLALTIVDALGDRIRDGRLAPGTKLATESALMAEFGVSRTVVREALSKLQAAALVQTRHGIGTFVTQGGSDSAVFRIRADQLETLHEVVAMLELRIGIETEAASLAALRRTDADLTALRGSLFAFNQAVEAGRDAVGPDFQFHLEIMRATQNPHFSTLLQSLGTRTIPRARLDPSSASADERQAYLRRVNAEHGSILDAIENRDSEAARAAMRTHLANSRERRRRAAQLARS